MSTHTQHPLIWLARRCTRPRVFGGSAAFSTAAESVWRAYFVGASWSSIGIVDDDLIAPRSALDLVAEGHTGAAQRLHGRVEIVHIDDDTVPSPASCRRPSGIGREPEAP